MIDNKHIHKDILMRNAKTFLFLCNNKLVFLYLPAFSETTIGKFIRRCTRAQISRMGRVVISRFNELFLIHCPISGTEP